MTAKIGHNGTEETAYAAQGIGSIKKWAILMSGMKVGGGGW